MSTTYESMAGALRLVELDPVFGQMYRATAEHADAIPELTAREKTFLRVTAHVCHASLGRGFDDDVRMGLAAGVSTADVRTLLRFVSYDSGYHVAAAALERLVELEVSLGIAPPVAELLADELVATGAGAAASPLPEPVRETLAELDVHFLEHFDLQSRMRSGHEPGTLSERERGLVSLSVDLHYQTLADTFRTHVGRAMRGGAEREDVRAALRFNAQFGVTRAWHAWQALNTYFATLEQEGR
ncbi:carboxymuconolactone decarboxylase family protein [Kribbella sp. NPDC026611]|uniref:carboxymuconolactone decarboxylase family protein n=1 Tax=Kribbella sp. NPDC026611 TaxID=3154911 RepID=UPI0033E18FB5